jgi:hypothetical protein
MVRLKLITSTPSWLMSRVETVSRAAGAHADVAPHVPVGVFLRFNVVKILSLHDPSDGGSPVPWPLAPIGGIRLGGVPDQVCWQRRTIRVEPPVDVGRERLVALSGTQSRSTAETATRLTVPPLPPTSPPFGGSL